MATILTAVDAVQKVVEVWKKIKARIEQQEVAEALATDLSDFELESKLVALQTDVENAQKVFRDASTPANRKDDLNAKYLRVYNLLQKIQPAIDNVVENAKKGTFRKHLRSSTNKQLTKIVEEYRTAFRDFSEAVVRANVATTGDSYLLIRPGEMKPVGKKPPQVIDGSDGITTARVSYRAPGLEKNEIVDVLWETLASTDGTWTADDTQLRALVRGLSGAEPHWHIPKLMGYEKNETDKTLRLVFKHPDPTRSLVSLGHVYTVVPDPPSLSLRVSLCYQLAFAVLQAHTARVNVVHKHIRPGNLLLAVPLDWNDGKTVTTIGSQGSVDLYLSGWQNSRLAGQNTFLVGESAATRVIHQHPQRHQTEDGEGIVEEYNIGHDIYSLGVCILELLTWEVLVKVDSTGDVLLADNYLDAFRKKGFYARIEVDDDDDDLDLAELCTRDATEIQATLVHMSQTCIPPKAGDRLGQLVCRCLTCLDPNPMYGGSRFHDGDNKQQISQEFCDEILSDLKKVLTALEVTRVNK